MTNEITKADHQGSILELSEKNLEHAIYAESRDTARRSGRTTADEATIVSLQSMADRRIARVYGEPYDPIKNPGDRLNEGEYKYTLADRGSLKQQVAYARAALRDRLIEAASWATARPTTPWLMLVFGILAISLTLAPTFHDLMFAAILKVRAQAMYSAVLAGAMLAGLIVWGTLGRAEHPKGASIVEAILTVFVAVGIGLGLYLMRLSVARRPEEKLLALGFAILECAMVVLVELFARGLHRKWIEYREHALPAEAQVEVAREYLQGRETELEACEAKIRGHAEKVERREKEARILAQVKEAARAIALAGYHKGLEENRGHVDDAAFVPVTTNRRRDRPRRSPALDSGQDDGMNGADGGTPWLG